MSSRIHVLGLGRDELRAQFVGLDLAGYRADQVRQWVFARRADDWDAMTNLSKADRARLAERFTIAAGRVVLHRVADDGVHKLLLAWHEETDAKRQAATHAQGQAPGDTRSEVAQVAIDSSEAVMIPSDDAGEPDAGSAGDERGPRSRTGRRTACVSTQVGCPVGCRFCASGIGGLQRNLSTGQIVEQVWQLARTTLPAGERISNFVLMGIGEPLANYDATVKAIRLINAPDGLNVGMRRITLSTVGLPAQIRRLAGEDLQITLAISLHAPNQALRAELIPWASRFPLHEVMSAARHYFERTGREVTLEYVLLGGINTEPEHADQLADLAGSLRCNVNLIHYNPVDGGLGVRDPGSAGGEPPGGSAAGPSDAARLCFRKASQREAVAFRDRLARRSVNVHIRPSRGLTIDAACGQLRRRSGPLEG